MNIATRDATNVAIPFDRERVDRIMEENGLDVLLASSKHNVQWFLGGYKFIFFAAMDAIGHSRYLPVLIYAKGAPEHAGYVGNRMETGEHHVHPFWTPAVQTTCWGTVDAAKEAAAHLKKIGKEKAHIGYEPAFLSADAYQALREALPDATLISATHALERIRAIKTPAEIDKLRKASELITDSMLAVFTNTGEGAGKAEIVEALRREETNRGLHFEYCLITLGSSHNRAVSAQHWHKGEVMSLDSGGNYQGYIGDLARMAVLGEPDAELKDLLAEIEVVQQAAFASVKASAMGGDIYAAAEKRLAQTSQHEHSEFLAHGMGLVSHEAPRLTNSGPVPYDDYDAHQPLEAGMVVSIETTMKHPTRGFIKLEDTVAVTTIGYEIFGQSGRGWNLGGTGR